MMNALDFFIVSRRSLIASTDLCADADVEVKRFDAVDVPVAKSRRITLVSDIDDFRDLKLWGAPMVVGRQVHKRSFRFYIYGKVVSGSIKSRIKKICGADQAICSFQCEDLDESDKRKLREALAKVGMDDDSCVLEVDTC